MCVFIAKDYAQLNLRNATKTRNMHQVFRIPYIEEVIRMDFSLTLNRLLLIFWFFIAFCFFHVFSFTLSQLTFSQPSSKTG